MPPVWIPTSGNPGAILCQPRKGRQVVEQMNDLEIYLFDRDIEKQLAAIIGRMQNDQKKRSETKTQNKDFGSSTCSEGFKEFDQINLEELKCFGI